MFVGVVNGEEGLSFCVLDLWHIAIDVEIGLAIDGTV